MPTPDKLDLFKANKDQYTAKTKPILVQLPSVQHVSIEGSGAPGEAEFQDAVGALYAVAFTLKAEGQEYVVCKLEAQRQIDNDKPFKQAKPDEIHFQLMIRKPDLVRRSHLTTARKALVDRGKTARANDVELRRLDEGTSVQMLHVGPHDQGHKTIDVIREFARAEGYTQFGRHHEIYLSDPRRVPPERLKTMLRLPVK